MNATSPLVLESPETLRLGPRGFDNIKNARHRRHVREVIERGYLHDALALLDEHPVPGGTIVAPYVANPYPYHVDGFAKRLQEEFEAWGLRCPPPLFRHMTAMRALLVPLDDDELAYALTRIWLVAPLVDDICEASPEANLMVLRTAAGQGDGSALSEYCQFMFAELERLASPVFVPVLRMMFYKSFIGTLFESHLAQHAAPLHEQTYDYIRHYNGICEFFFLSLQFKGGSLAYPGNAAFWADIMSPCVAYLNDFNDVLSIYKEAVNGGDFAASRMFLKSLRQDAPSYADVYQATLQSGMASYEAIARTAACHAIDAQIHLVHFMRGFVYWQLHCPRYRWRELFPNLVDGKSVLG